MFESFKGHAIRDTILILMLAIMVLTGCKHDMYVDLPETTKNLEYDEIETREPDTLNDLEKLNSMEIYELFLNGELTVEWEERQVLINELFWDNDIEYCFFDIDGDGSEELHVKDSTIYYAVKVQNETPQIIFDGWWIYEPIMTDKLCGILYHFYGYGDEKIEYIEISADGSMESDGVFEWSDKNKDGNIDEEDYFWGRGDIDMEQYIQYREEHIAEQAENMLEWTGKRLKNFGTWQEAYADFINKIHVTVPFLDDAFRYSLIYVDSDDIPELYIYTGNMVGGEIIVSFYDGSIGTMNRDRCGITYIEYGGLLYNGNGATGFYPCNVYMLERGKFSEIGTGWQTDHVDEQENIYFDYYWEGRAVTETEYNAYINELIDTSKCVEPSLLYLEDEILEILTD